MSEEVSRSTAVRSREPAVRDAAAVRRRDFRLLWGGEAVSGLGTGISGVAIALTAVTALHASTFMVALIRAASWLPWLLIGLPAGVWIDRLQRRRVMLACDAASLLLLASVPVAAVSGVLGVPQLVAVALGVGASSVFFTAAYQAYLPTLVAKEDLGGANAKLQTTQQVTGVAGPGTGGLIAQAAGAVAGVLADAATFAVSAACLLRIRTAEPQPTGERSRRDLRAEVAEGVRFVVHDPYLRVLTVAGALDNLTWTSSAALYVVYLVRDLHAPPSAVGFMTAADSVGGVVGGLLAVRVARRFGTARGMLLAALGTAPFTLLIPLAGPGPRLLLFALGLMVAGAGLTVCNILSGGFRQAYVPQRILGRVYASSRVLQFGVIPVAALLGGALGTVLGVREALWITLGAGVLLKGVRLLGPVRTHRDLPTAPPAATVRAAQAAAGA
ncbi:MFS transporter [Streptomyces sp. NPDC001380]|uniref:MFS transporter n=1 Tax=Streptomyces sp. NPDC001380 TaxID=3364566 RepID=UPI003680122B